MTQSSPLPKDRASVTPTPAGIQPCLPGHKGIPVVVPVLLSTIEGISHLRLFMPKDIRQEHSRESLWKSVLEVQRRFKDGVALLDPIENMGIKDDKFIELVQVRDTPLLAVTEFMAMHPSRARRIG